MNETLEVTLSDAVAEVVLNRPTKHNAVDREMFDALTEAGSTLADRRDLRAVVLRGAGDNFCAGIDVSVFANGEIDPASMQALPKTPANLYQNAAYAWRSLPVPVIAALRGAVFGAGLQIALGADVRIASPDARLSVMESKWGLIPDMAASITFPAVLPYDTAAELTWTGRIVSADEAGRLGLVSSITEDPVAAARAMARTIASRSPDAVRAAKRLLLEAYGHDDANRDAALLRREAELQLGVLRGANQREAVRANLEKRDPEFGDSRF